ncbi:MAG: LysR substrate-binding domain-containing protein [Pseudomonadota bacterium]
MDVRQIETFQAVMIFGTTARAAKTLGVSQPAVSKAIAALERSVGFQLFDREKGRLVPTTEGQLYFREVQLAFAGITKLRSAAARIRDYGSGDIKFACRSALSNSLVPTAIKQFRNHNPDIAVTLHVASSSTIRDMVAAGQIDVALVADEVDTSGVDAELFRDDPAVLAMPPDHALSEKTSITPSDLHGQDFVALAPEDTTRGRQKTCSNAGMWPPRSCRRHPIFRPSAAWPWPGMGADLFIRYRPSSSGIEV